MFMHDSTDKVFPLLTASPLCVVDSARWVCASSSTNCFCLFSEVCNKPSLSDPVREPDASTTKDGSRTEGPPSGAGVTVSVVTTDVVDVDNLRWQNELRKGDELRKGEKNHQHIFEQPREALGVLGALSGTVVPVAKADEFQEPRINYFSHDLIKKEAVEGRQCAPKKSEEYPRLKGRKDPGGGYPPHQRLRSEEKAPSQERTKRARTTRHGEKILLNIHQMDTMLKNMRRHQEERRGRRRNKPIGSALEHEGARHVKVAKQHGELVGFRELAMNHGENSSEHLVMDLCRASDVIAADLV
jgi:hypothetical protein